MFTAHGVQFDNRVHFPGFYCFPYTTSSRLYHIGRAFLQRTTMLSSTHHHYAYQLTYTHDPYPMVEKFDKLQTLVLFWWVENQCEIIGMGPHKFSIQIGIRMCPRPQVLP